MYTMSKNVVSSVSIHCQRLRTVTLNLFFFIVCTFSPIQTTVCMFSLSTPTLCTCSPNQLTLCTCSANHLTVCMLSPSKPTLCTCSPNNLTVCVLSPSKPTLCTCSPNHVTVCVLSPSKPTLCTCSPNHLTVCMLSLSKPTLCTCSPYHLTVCTISPSKPTLCTCSPNHLTVCMLSPSKPTLCTCSPNHPTPSAHTCCRLSWPFSLQTACQHRHNAVSQCPQLATNRHTAATVRTTHTTALQTQAATSAPLQSARLTTPRHPCDIQRRPSGSCSEAKFRVVSETPRCAIHWHKHRDGNGAAMRLSQRC